MLIQLKDMSITDITDENYIVNEGCETCDYGKTVATNFTIYFSNNTINTIYIESGESVSMSCLIKFFVNTDFSEMSKKQFLNKLCNFIKKEHKGYEEFELRKD